MSSFKPLTKKNTAVYDENLHMVTHHYSGYIKYDFFVKQSSHAIELIKENQVTKMFVDLHDMDVLPFQTQEWLQKEWFPLAIEAGLKRMAFVMPQSIFGQTSMENANKEARKQAIDIMYFYKHEEAIEWLLD